MWPFDYFKKKKEEEQRKLAAEKEAIESAERERRLAEAKRLEEERRQKEREHNEAIRRQEEAKQKEKSLFSNLKPFVFKSDQHQRYENGNPVLGLQNCGRTVYLEKNTTGCKGYQITPGDGYIVRIINEDTGKPQMAAKPMRVSNVTGNTVELKGYTVPAQTPFGWQEIDLSDYGITVFYENDAVCKCIFHMYDRNVDLEYRQTKSDLSVKPTSTGAKTKAEVMADCAVLYADQNNKTEAHKVGLKVLNEIISNPNQLQSVATFDNIGLALGKMMEGDYFQDADEIIRAVAITYWSLTKAIKNRQYPDPRLYMYRFSLVWEYNKAMYKILAHSQGKQYSNNPYDIFSQSALMAYDHQCEAMQMSDMFTEPKIGQLDANLKRIFNESASKYKDLTAEQVLPVGNKYHNLVFEYIDTKIKDNNLDFSTL